MREIREHYSFRTPTEVAVYLLNRVYTPFHQFKQEHLYVLLLDNRNNITHDVLVYKGTVNLVLVRVSEVFMEAVKLNAPFIILSHCHPNGSIEPPPEDIRMTEEVYKAGQLLDIQVLDHIIIGSGKWVSLKEKGMGFP